MVYWFERLVPIQQTKLRYIKTVLVLVGVEEEKKMRKGPIIIIQTVYRLPY